MKDEQQATRSLSAEQRHKNMAAIKSKDTKPELIVRRGLWRMGFRYRLNHKRLPGHPDLVLRKYRTCIFVNGCFWHGHGVDLQAGLSLAAVANSVCCKIPRTNREFWVSKLRRNQQRDREEQRRLATMGWHCITVWECELTPRRREATLASLAYTLNHIWLQDHALPTLSDGVAAERRYPQLGEEDSRLPMAAEALGGEAE